MDPIGQSGDIWIIWDPFRVIVQTLEANHQVIHAKIKRENHPHWILSAIYARPNPCNRDVLWTNLESMADNMQDPWLVARDFNDIASLSEKRSFATNFHHGRSQNFFDRLSKCNLMDLGYSGPHLTWSNGRQGLANTLYSTDLREAFLEEAVRNLPRTYSDHSPMVIYTQGCLKLNIDGCARGDPVEGGFGGLFKNEDGEWVCGFYGKLWSCTSLEAELWRIYRGLTIALEKGFYGFIIEYHFSMAIEMLCNGAPPKSPFKSLVEDSRHLMQRCNGEAQHVCRKGN